MTFSTLRRLVVRCWYVTLTGLLATAALIYAAIVVVPARYSASSDLLLLPPRPQGRISTTNPYLNLSGYEAFADIVARAASDTESVAKLRRNGVAYPFTIVRDLTTNGPLIRITVVGAKPREVSRDLRTVLAVIPEVTRSLQGQQSVEARYQFVPVVVTEGGPPSVVRKSQIRAAVVAAAAGILATALALTLVERLLRRRRAGVVAVQAAPPTSPRAMPAPVPPRAPTVAAATPTTGSPAPRRIARAGFSPAALQASRSRALAASGSARVERSTGDG